MMALNALYFEGNGMNWSKKLSCSSPAALQFCQGVLVALIMASPAANAAQVFTTDVVVQGSECVGVDCVNGESFGFDTLRLKENNLRIKFQDTSVSASFPTVDWQLTANDSSNGGANKFSIDDIDSGRTPFTIEASAPSNSLYVDDGGRVGLGTATPVVELHVVDGDSPTMRLEQDGSSGFTAQTWDVAGNEANFFVRDATNGSTLPFKIKPGAPSNSLFVDADGALGFGTQSPDSGLDVRTALSTVVTGRDALRLGINVTPRVQMEHDSSIWEFDNYQGTFRIFEPGIPRFNMHSGGFIAINSTETANPLTIGDSTGNGNGAFLSVAGVWTDASSRKNKTEIEDLQVAEAMRALEELNPVTYKGKQDPSGEQYVGFIAEDIPDLVAVPGRTGVAAIEVVAVLTRVVKEQQQMIDHLNARLDQLNLE
jgi:hypothetical protein